jgi:hypothetical protein
MSILVSIRAFGTAGSMPDWSLCRVVWVVRIMHGGGSGSKIGGISPVDKFSYTMGLYELIIHGGCRCLMATIGPYAWLLSIQ